MEFSYLAYFMAICALEAHHVPKTDGQILVRTAEATCNFQHTKCMVKRLKGNTGWRLEDVQLKAAKCVLDVEAKNKFN